MSSPEIPMDGSYYADGRRVLKAPVECERDAEGRRTISCGFPVLDMWEGVKDPEKAAQEIAFAMNLARKLDAPSDATAEKVARAFEPMLWQRIDKDLPGGSLVNAAIYARNSSLERARAAIAALVTT